MTITLGRTETARLQNKSGVSLAYGDVVVVSTADAKAVAITSTRKYIASRIGVVLEPNGIASDAWGIIAFSGYVPKINLSASAALGDFIIHSATSKQGEPVAAPALQGSFAFTLETGTAPSALLLGHQVVVDGAGVYFAPSGLIGAQEQSRYVGATTSGAPATGTFQVGDFVIDRTGAIWVCKTAGTPGTWVNISGGGGGGWWNPFTNPNSYSWSWVNQGDATITSGNGREYLYQPAGAAVNYRLRVLSAPATPYKITAAFIFNPGRNQPYTQFGLFWRESATGKFTGIAHLVGGTIECSKWNSPTSINSQYFTGTGAWRFAQIAWLQIEDNGTTRYFRISSDSYNFVDIYSVARTDFITPDQVGWGLSLNSTDDNNNAGVTLMSWLVS